MAHLHAPFDLFVHSVPADPGGGLIAGLERNLDRRPTLETMDTLGPGQAHLARHEYGDVSGQLTMVGDLPVSDRRIRNGKPVLSSNAPWPRLTLDSDQDSYRLPTRIAGSRPERETSLGITAP